MLRTASRALALFVVCAMSTAESADKKHEDEDKLRGTWVVVGAEFDGSEAKCELKKGEKLIFDGKKFKFESKKYHEEGTFAVEGEQKVKDINLVDEKEKKAQGIYEMNNEELKLCYREGERPKEFKSSNRALLINLKRQK